MITAIVYIALEKLTPGYSGWLLLLPILLDLAITNWAMALINNRK